MEKELLEFAAIALGMDVTQVTALVKSGETVLPNAKQALLDKHAAKVAADQAEEKRKSDEKATNFHKKGMAEMNEKWMTEVSKHGIDKSLATDDALKALTTTIETMKDGSTDEAKILKSSVHINAIAKLQEQKNKEMEEAVNKVKQEFDGFKGEVAGKELTGKVRNLYDAEVAKLTLQDGLNDEQKKWILDNAFNQVTGGNKFKVLDDGKTVVLVDDEGKPKLDGHNNFIKAESLIANAIKVIHLKAGTQRVTLGQDGKPVNEGAAGGPYNGTLKLPKDLTEFSTMSAQHLADKRAGKIKDEDFKAWNDAAEAAINPAQAA